MSFGSAHQAGLLIAGKPECPARATSPALENWPLLKRPWNPAFMAHHGSRTSVNEPTAGRFASNPPDRCHVLGANAPTRFKSSSPFEPQPVTPSGILGRNSS